MMLQDVGRSISSSALWLVSQGVLCLRIVCLASSSVCLVPYREHKKSFQSDTWQTRNPTRGRARVFQKGHFVSLFCSKHACLRDKDGPGLLHAHMSTVSILDHHAHVLGQHTSRSKATGFPFKKKSTVVAPR